MNPLARYAPAGQAVFCAFLCYCYGFVLWYDECKAVCCKPNYDQSAIVLFDLELDTVLWRWPRYCRVCWHCWTASSLRAASTRANCWANWVFFASLSMWPACRYIDRMISWRTLVGFGFLGIIINNTVFFKKVRIKNSAWNIKKQRIHTGKHGVQSLGLQ